MFLFCDAITTAMSNINYAMWTQCRDNVICSLLPSLQGEQQKKLRECQNSSDKNFGPSALWSIGHHKQSEPPEQKKYLKLLIARARGRK